jgi:hypothetical protein
VVLFGLLDSGKYQSTLESFFLPQDRQIRVLEEGVSQDEVITGDIGDKEQMSHRSSVVHNDESNRIGYLSGLDKLPSADR